MSREPEPLYAQGFFIMHETGLVDQILVFDYIDKDKYYWNLFRDRSRLEREKKMLMDNMQYFLDQEKVYINDKEAPPQVINIELGFRGKPILPYIVFNIVFSGELRRGVNRYVDIYGEEEAEYDYTVQWLFPEGATVIEAKLGVDYTVEASGRQLVFHVKKGMRIGGREEIVFRFP
jgi:hypothetical protein